MRRVSLEVGRQIDDLNCLEGTLLNANTATDAEVLRDRSDLIVWRHFNAQLAHPDDWTGLLAFLATSFRLAFVC